MARLRISLFGSPTITLAEEGNADLRSDKARALLAYLAVEAAQAHRREKLAGLLWPDYTEASARANLRRALADLRQAIRDHEAPRPVLLVTQEAIQFDAAADAWADVSAFSSLLKRAAATGKTEPRDAGPSLDDLAQAVGLYRAPFLESFSIPDSAPFEEWLVLTRERLDRLAREALSLLAGAYQERCEYATALQYAWRLLEMDPWQENAHRQVMQLLALSGQRGAALAQYETCRKVLETELGAEPSADTRRLYELLRSGQWPPAQPAAALQQGVQARTVGPCPYRGLAAFEEADAPFFFGREDFTARLAGAVAQPGQLTVVVGSSGSGKSSVVSAGLLPRLREFGDWLIVQFRPGGQPFHALAAALLPCLEPEQSETDRLLETGKLARPLRGGDVTLAAAAAAALAKRPGAARMLLVVDQFEEVYTLCPDAQVRQAFLDGLLAGADGKGNGSPGKLAVLLTLRADFMAQALAYRPFADALQVGALMLGPMNRGELRAAIEKPAERQGAAFEPGLVDRILDDVGQEPGSLPLLEFALTVCWERQAAGWLTHAAYEEIGRAEGALARYAEEAFGGLTQHDQDRVRRVFMQLVRPGEGTEDTRRVATRSEIGEENWPLARRLADLRLVVTGRDAGTGCEIAEVAHEALIQRWGRLQDWMAADRAFRTWQERLRAALAQWDATAHDEGTLLAGAPLVEAEGWLDARPDELSEAEREFIRAGVARREQREREREAQRQRERAAERRGRRLLMALAGVLAVAALIAAAATIFSAAQRRGALQAYSLSLAANAQGALDGLDAGTGLVLSLAANRIDNPPRAAQRVLMDAAYAPGPRWRADVAALFPGVQGPATSLAISPDGRVALSGLAAGDLVLWDIASQREIFRLSGHTARVNAAAISRDGSRALSGSDDGRVILWDLATGQEVRRFVGHSGVVRATDMTPDGRLGVSGGFGGASLLAPGELILWDLGTGREIRRFVGHKAGVVAARFTPDGTALLASSGDARLFSDALYTSEVEQKASGLVVGDMLLWDVATGQMLRRFEGSDSDAYSLAIAPDGTQAVAGSFYNKVAVVWDLRSGKKIRTLEGHRDGVSAVAWSSDGKRLLSGSYDNSLTLWDAASGQAVSHLNAHGTAVLAVAFAPDGRTGLSSSSDGGLILWDLVDAQEIGRLAGHEDAVYDVAFTPDGRQALSSSGAASPSVAVKDASVRLWNLETGMQTRVATLPVDVILQVAISPDGRTALVGATQPSIRIWDLTTWQETGRLEGHAGPVTSLDFTPDGQRALSASVDGTLVLWDVARRQAIRRFNGHGPGLWGLAISPDGRTALSDSADSAMILWDLETGAELRTFVRADPPAEPGSSGMAFLPDGRTAIAVANDGQLIEWNLATGAEVRRLGSHPSLRTRIVISPDGRLAMTSGMDGTLMLWDLKTGSLVRRSTGHGPMMDLAIDPAGGSILAGSGDGSIFRWRMSNPSPAELNTWVRANRFVRSPSCEEQKLFQIEPAGGGTC